MATTNATLPTVRCRCPRCTVRGLIGPVLLITIGLLFLLGQMRSDLSFWGKTWPVVLLVFGALKVAAALAFSEGHIGPSGAARPRRRSSIFGGVLLLLMGSIFLVQNFYGDFGFLEIFKKWWPLLLILLGVAKLFDRLAAQRTGKNRPEPLRAAKLVSSCS